MGITDALEQATGGNYDDPDGLEREHEAEVEVAGGDNSMLAAIRGRVEQLRQETTVDLPIPGYDNLLGRYKAISLPRVYGKGGGFNNPMGEDWGMGADALATALVGLYGINPAGKTAPIYSDGEPARYDDDLAERLGLHPKARTARAVMVALFGVDDDRRGESRIWAHFMAYQGWLTGGTEASEVVDTAVGESASGD